MIGSSYYRCSFAAKMARARRDRSERGADSGIFEADRRRAASVSAGAALGGSARIAPETPAERDPAI